MRHAVAALLLAILGSWCLASPPRLAARRHLDDRQAVVSLLHQNANEPEVRARIVALLGAPAAEVREAAAEYLLWHGTDAEREALAAAIAREEDPHALAVEQEARRAIVRRGAWAGLAQRRGAQTAPVAADTCLQAWSALKARPTVETLRQSGKTYRTAWAVTPKLVYQGAEVDASALAERRACFNLAASIFRFTDAVVDRSRDRPGDPPVAASFMPPVRDYFQSSPLTFGVHTGNDRGPFRGSVHCGDDVAWRAEEGTVVAVGDGIVRQVDHIYSWGFIVIIEHRLPGRGGVYCSLYGHLSASVSVVPGQVVRKGDRIGSLGRSHTWENGGYPAHLHFGIHRGAYVQRRLSSDGRPEPGKADAAWVAGYVDATRWADGLHGWVEPRAFIRERLEIRPDACAATH